MEATFPLAIREDPARLFYLGLSLVSLFLLGFLIARTTSGHATLLILPLFFLGGASAEARLDIGPARVGELTRIDLIPPDRRAAEVNFSIVRAEDGKTLFRIGDIRLRGQSSWGYHFFDGSAHRVRAAVSPEGSTSSLIEEKDVQVEAFEPPRSAVFRTYPFFLLPIVLGWLTGRWMRRSRGRP